MAHKTPVIIGRKPSGNDSGWGVAQSGWARGSIIGRTTYKGWIIKFGGRIGKPSSGSSNASGQYAIYKVSGSTVTNRVGTSDGSVAASAVFASTSGGANVEDTPLAPIMWDANQDYALFVRSSANTLHFGQDLSGYVMHKRNGLASFPDPFSAASADPEGKMSLWVYVVPNTAPNTPSNVAPAENGFTTSANPTMAADFRDEDEVLTGFTLGQGDKVKSYRFRVLSADLSTVVKDSGILAADATMQTNRRATWTVTGGALPTAQYVGECTLWDMRDAPSAVKQWTFTVGSAGALDVSLYPAHNVGGNETTNDTPGVQWVWSHGSSLSLDQYEISIQNAAGATIRGPVTVDPANQIPGTYNNLALFTTHGFAALARGADYRFAMRALDTLGQWTPVTTSALFHVDATPSVPTALSPASGTSVIAIPTLSATFSDADDDASSLTVEFEAKASASGTWLAVPGASYAGNGVWQVTPSSTVITGVGTWNWRARATDPLGLVGSYTASQILNYVTAPTLTALYPTNASTITTGTPSISATVDRPVTSWRAEVLSPAGLRVHDSGLVASGTILSAIAPGKIANNTTYTLKLTVTTSDGLTTIFTSIFTLAYPLRSGPTNVTATAVSGDFEPVAAQYSEVLIDWDNLPESASQIYTAQLNGSLASDATAGPATLTSSGALRYGDGPTPNPHADAGKTNHILNPRFGLAGLNNTASLGTPTRNRVAATGLEAYGISFAADVTTPGSVSAEGHRWVGSIAMGGRSVRSFAGGCFVKSPSGATVSVNIVAIYVGGGFTEIMGTPITLTNEWQFIPTPIVTTTTTNALTQLYVDVRVPSGVTAGINFQCTGAIVIESSSPVTGYWAGHRALCEWLGAADSAPSRMYASIDRAAIIEEGTTNLFPNPECNANANLWNPGTSTTVTRITTAFILNPRGTAAQAVTTGVAAAGLIIDTAAALGYTGSARVFKCSAYASWSHGTSFDVFARILYTDATSTQGATTVYTSGQAGRIEAPIVTADSAKTVDKVQLHIRATGAHTATTLWATRAQCEEKISGATYATTYCPEYVAGSTTTLVSGITWAGTAHDSACTRANTFVHIASLPPGFSSIKGSAIVQFMQPLDMVARAGVSSRAFNIGSYNNTGDALMILMGGTQIRGSFTVNGSGNQYAGAGHVTSRGVWYVAYIEWDGINTRTVVNGVSSVGTRSTPIGTVNSDAVVRLGSDNGAGVMMNGYFGASAIFNRPLTDTELASVVSRMQSGSVSTLAGVLPYATALEFGGYVIDAIYEDGERETLDVLMSRDESSYRFKRPRHADVTTYEVSYLHLANVIDWLRSAGATDAEMIVLEQAVITDLALGGRSVPVRYWDDRDLEYVRDVETIETLEDSAPIGFQGILDYVSIDVDWNASDDEYGTFLVGDLLEAFRDIGRAKLDDDGNPIPRDLYWRDPRKRAFPIVVSRYRESDPHSLKRSSGSFRVTQVGTRSESDE